MTTDRNKHGLSRSIPEAVKRQVRRECGFGCVLCGVAIIQYDHFDPEFTDAQQHSATGIALLCGGCHDKKTRGWISAEAIAEARRNPCALRAGFVRQALELGATQLTIFIGGVVVHSRTILRVADMDVVTVDPPEEIGAPYRLNAMFKDAAGAVVCQIVENEIVIRTGQWDIEFVGPALTVKSGPGAVALKLITMPAQGIRVSALDMVHDGRSVRVDAEGNLIFNGQIQLPAGLALLAPNAAVAIHVL